MQKLRKQFEKQGIKLGLTGAALLAYVNSAMAAIDVTAVVTEIQGTAAPIASIGAAVLIVMVGIKVYKWLRRAM